MASKSLLQRIVRDVGRTLQKISPYTLLFSALLSIGIGVAIYYAGLDARINEVASHVGPIALAAFALLITLLTYLRTNTYKFHRESIEEFANLSENFQTIQSKVEKSIETKAGLTPDEKLQLLDYLRKQLETESAQGVLNEIRQQHEKALSKLDMLSGIERRFTESSRRLAEEVDALGTRSNLNLAIGIVTAIAGLAVMATLVFSNGSMDKEWIAIASHYVPRTSLVIFVEVFAYFFLKLYKVNLSEIKYFQNELTNLESKYAALRIALIVDDKEMRSKVVYELAKTERNFVLKKGESTVEIEAKKADKDYVVEIATAVAEAVGKSKRGKKE